MVTNYLYHLKLLLALIVKEQFLQNNTCADQDSLDSSMQLSSLNQAKRAIFPLWHWDFFKFHLLYLTNINLYFINKLLNVTYYYYHT